MPPLPAGPVAVLCGAGLAAASGVPTFRGPAGLWRRHRPEELATPAAFARDPRLVWEWYDWRRGLIAGCRPNAGHRALARLAGSRPGTTLISQNVDGLQERVPPARPLLLHGSIWRLRCAGGCGRGEWEDRRPRLPELPPRCPDCGGLARPAVVWFGEGLPAGSWRRAAAAASACALFLAVGTSAVVQPAAGLIDLARSAGAVTIEVNPEPTAAAVDHRLVGPAEEILPALVAALV